ncbi:MAG TPA: TerB family tellurite resistance protein [Chitinophagaceae bacterium]|jgi:uncharacterized tellurite resistance protein B-like protein|nr:TerB family tellurite resistance protein [Chitinophagaceae bacterium]
MEQTPEKLLKEYSDREKGAYLGAIASIATADRTASEEELQFIEELADTAELSAEQKESVHRAATELSGEELKQCLDILKTSDLRYSLITDLIAFAESDQNYTAEEKASVEKIAAYLNINQQQFSVLNQFVNKTAESGATPEQMQSHGFLDNLGLGDKLKGAGINTGSLMKGVLGMAAPFLLASLLRGGRRRGGGMLGGGMLGGGGGLGGMLGGGLGGMLGGGGMGGMMGGGGLGSLIGMLSGGRGMRSTGGLFGRMMGGRGLGF